MAYAYQNELNKEQMGDYQLIFFIVNNRNQQLIDTYRVAKLLSTDATELDLITLETARYMVQSNIRAIGLRVIVYFV